MTNSEKEKIIEILERGLYFNEDPDKEITVDLPREYAISLVSMLKRIDILRCLKIISDEDFIHYPRDVLEDYIKNARPVSSKSLCDALNCSSATIRAEMNYLEEVGLLEKTHISSGRVPSEEGYRYYVDNIMEKKELSDEDTKQTGIL